MMMISSSKGPMPIAGYVTEELNDDDDDDENTPVCHGYN